MANLMLTSRCNLDCDFCFALDIMGETSKTAPDVPFDTFKAYIDLLDRSGLGQVRLLGGEPTLHPQFVRFMEYSRSHGKTVLVFSNGLIPDAVLDALAEVPAADCKVLVNLAAGDAFPSVRRRQEHALTRLGERACPGYTISRLDHPDLSQLLDVIDRTGCQRSLRIAMSQPSGGANAFIHPKQYRQVAQRIMALTIEAGRRNVCVEFDCGFVRCMFSNDEITVLRENNVSMAWHCSPVWDVTPDALALPCFALAERLQIPAGLDASLEELRRQYDSMFAVLRVAGVYPECSSCEFRITDGCSGGCLAVTLRRLRHTPITRVLTASEASAFAST